MRKGIAIALFVLLLFFTAGYHLLFYVRIAEAKADMKEAIGNGRPENLTKLHFSTHLFKSINPDGGDEFEYAGELYDVIKAEAAGGDVIVWCLADKKEKEAVDAYLKTQKQSSNSDSSDSLIRLLKLLFMPVAFQWYQKPTQTHEQHLSIYFTHFASTTASVITPPPKVC